MAVVSDSLRPQYWPGQNPLGRRFRFGNPRAHGRRGRGRHQGARARAIERAAGLPRVPPGGRRRDHRIRAEGPGDSDLAAAERPGPRGARDRRKRRSEIPVSDVRPLSEIVRGETAPRRVQARVLGAFAAIAFLLAGVGIHGVLAFTVSQRLREIGVRIAMGAQRADILRLVLAPRGPPVGDRARRWAWRWPLPRGARCRRSSSASAPRTRPRFCAPSHFRSS